MILIKWYRGPSAVGVVGTVELWRLNGTGNPKREQDEQIFPVPASTQSSIMVTVQDLFGAGLLQGRPPQTIFSFRLDDLRRVAQAAMARQSLVPL